MPWLLCGRMQYDYKQTNTCCERLSKAQVCELRSICESIYSSVFNRVLPLESVLRSGEPSRP